MVVLVIAPHPDDEVLGCGGVMARHAAEGDEVHVLIVTRGAPAVFTPEQVERARQGLRAAHEILGVSNVHFLDFPAPGLDTIPEYELADAIHQVIEPLHPTVIYLPHWGDLHADHRAVFHATLVATRPVNRCPTRRLMCYETLSETEWAPPVGHEAFVPTIFVNIADYLDHKLRAMSCYRCQLKEPPHARSLQSIEALARLRGGTVSLPAAEAFMLVREIIE